MRFKSSPAKFVLMHGAGESMAIRRYFILEFSLIRSPATMKFPFPR